MIDAAASSPVGWGKLAHPNMVRRTGRISVGLNAKQALARFAYPNLRVVINPVAWTESI